jgi:hypothetical protein
VTDTPATSPGDSTPEAAARAVRCVVVGGSLVGPSAAIQHVVRSEQATAAYLAHAVKSADR